MAVYAIGDVQGCYQTLERLLAGIHFMPEKDCLWFVGDLVNRGPDSLAVLEFIYHLPNKKVVLGNHDLHFLAVAHGVEAIRSKDTFQDILASPRCALLSEWLANQPLIHIDKDLGYGMVHAGLPPQWTLAQAQRYAEEVHAVLTSDQIKSFLSHLYGNEPALWSDDLSGYDRLRLICNYFTRMRVCDQEGRLELNFKGFLGSQPPGLDAWYAWPCAWANEIKMLFGHWSALGGLSQVNNAVALDTGCGWGLQLSALRLDDGEMIMVNASTSSRMSSKSS